MRTTLYAPPPQQTIPAGAVENYAYVPDHTHEISENLVEGRLSFFVSKWLWERNRKGDIDGDVDKDSRDLNVLGACRLICNQWNRLMILCVEFRADTVSHFKVLLIK